MCSMLQSNKICWIASHHSVTSTIHSSHSTVIAERSFPVCDKATPVSLRQLSTNIDVFMTSLRNIVTEQKKTVRPKMHMLEWHTVDCIKEFGVCLGLMGEQGGESIHRCFKHLRSSISNVNRDVDRLRVHFWQYLNHTLPR
eukprot:scpid6474/ scgid23786/ 